jgi:hypothetical protein
MLSKVANRSEKRWPKPTISKGRPKNSAGGDGGGRGGGQSNRGGRAQAGKASSTAASSELGSRAAASGELGGRVTSGRRGNLGGGVVASSELGNEGNRLDHEQCLAKLSSYPISGSLPVRRMGMGMCLFVGELF